MRLELGDELGREEWKGLYGWGTAESTSGGFPGRSIYLELELPAKLELWIEECEECYKKGIVRTVLRPMIDCDEMIWEDSYVKDGLVGRYRREEGYFRSPGDGWCGPGNRPVEMGIERNTCKSKTILFVGGWQALLTLPLLLVSKLWNVS